MTDPMTEGHRFQMEELNRILHCRERKTKRWEGIKKSRGIQCSTANKQTEEGATGKGRVRGEEEEEEDCAMKNSRWTSMK